MAWKNEWEDCCGTCRHHRADEYGDWICSNTNSDCYGCETAYDDGPCDEYRSRGVVERDLFND